MEYQVITAIRHRESRQRDVAIHLYDLGRFSMDCRVAMLLAMTADSGLFTIDKKVQ
ncbi:hypothetical protein [Chlorobaculum limnaeum]|uniref:hypothetical protein n=1 Tax=Chlorobaculum limnaeum TaxID=274537 RepID=UPI001969EF4C|nr:hypothetical protein [Chlorobaculum limnaeum]